MSFPQDLFSIRSQNYAYKLIVYCLQKFALIKQLWVMLLVELAMQQLKLSRTVLHPSLASSRGSWSCWWWWSPPSWSSSPGTQLRRLSRRVRSWDRSWGERGVSRLTDQEHGAPCVLTSPGKCCSSPVVTSACVETAARDCGALVTSVQSAESTLSILRELTSPDQI